MANGRPTKFTDDIALGICLTIAEGNYRSVAARKYGVSPRTLRAWLASGRQFPDGAYGTLRELILEAEATAEAIFVQAVTRGGLTDPWLMLAFLERKYPHRWGRYRGELGQLKRRLQSMEKSIRDEGLGKDLDKDDHERPEHR